jgi:uroporphyrinogen decarboxylase
MGTKEVIKETEEWRIIKDGRGATLKFWKNKSGTPEHIDFEITDREKWKKYREPLLEIRKERLGDIESMRLNLKTAREKKKFTIFGDLFIFELMRATIGDQNFLPALLLDPDWIKDFAQVYLNFYRNHYEILFREAGLPDGFLVYEDFGYSNGLFCSPKVLSELIMPYEKELVNFLKSYGLPVILHSCGDIRKAVPLIIDAGFDCLQPMEAKAGCDVVEFAKTYGNKLAYMGNINVVVLNTNDPLKIKEEILPKLKTLSKMRIPYFFHSDHSIPPTVTLETYKYALKLFGENCWYS